MIKTKICGLKRECDIAVANEMKSDYIGFLFAKSKRQIDKETAKFLKSKLDPSITAVGVFVNHDVNDIISMLNEKIIDVAQLHGAESEEDILAIQKTGAKVIKAVSVKTIDDILKWQNSAVDFLLLDNGSGGSGEKFDWDLMNLLEDFNKPYFIAGGLNPENVKEVLKFEPYGVDVSGGVETGDFKDEDKIRLFIRNVRGNHE